ncbi:MAG TPA: FHA domain-containing protein [Oscillatoriaceae cyanobacterium M33_DOE_052]|uniref:FHA domain-containing protein n=1 Tax=Planktothricoides sp. SpSt-374 TaxID=2282167 RepID=A0A7C3ZNE2_9CYAN|nr:FHA domain-containing protein [Oscillatoriaceae cyanobacterium M33_DOE_052]
MINLTLLHSQQTLPCQKWYFDDKAVIRIGRAPDNDVVIYSAVVSRYHLELHRISGNYWKVVNLGTNGTYVHDDCSGSATLRPITQVPVIDGMVIRLASSGPKIKIQKGEKLSNFTNAMASQTSRFANQESSADKTQEDIKALAC